MAQTKDNPVFAPIARTQDYTDLTIDCSGFKFYVHKIIVCSRCNVIKAAVDGFFKNHITPSPENRDDLIITTEDSVVTVIHINGFDPDTVDRMIEFIYTGTYSASSTARSDKPIASHVLAALGAFREGRRFIPESPFSTDLNDLRFDPVEYLRRPFNPLLLHVRVHAIADYFNLPSLRILANRKIDRLLQQHWNVEWFAHFAQAVADTCQTDTELLSIVTTMAALHIEELAGRDDWGKLDIPGGVHGDIYSKIMQAQALQPNERGSLSTDSCLRSVQ